MDTIFALASSPGKSGVSIVRVSGASAFVALDHFGCYRPKPRQASIQHLNSPNGVLDKALILAFEGPASFTGEDVVEFHLHGSTAIVKSVLASLGGCRGFRLAEAGEFTRRAFENEKLDLTQIEGLSDLIEAETEAQRKQAMRVLSGALGQKALSWRRDLIRAVSLIEATIDFADEDVPVDVVPEVLELVQKVSAELEIERDGAQAAERIRSGYEVAIVGPPNVGKSTLLNTLAGRSAAITSEIAGTTRDVIEVQMDLKGLPITFLDTAGLRVSSDQIESLGIERAKERAQQSDLCVVLLDNANDVPVVAPRKGDILVVSKSDLGNGDFSSVTGSGLDDLITRIVAELEGRSAGAGLAIRERHRVAIEDAISSLGIVKDKLEMSPGLTELISEDLRIAIRALDSLVGHVDVEHILDEIFSSFCLGK